MAQRRSKAKLPGWIGGFAQSNCNFAYPKCDLSSLPLWDNMANIGRLQRQQKVRWPEFSWETVPGHKESRCFQMFSPDISRIGYTDTGRVYSIICPQTGVYHPHLGTLNLEVTVTGTRGWVDEGWVHEKAPKNQNLAADLTAQGQIWLSPAANQGLKTEILWWWFANNGLPFPSSKANSIKVHLFNSQNTSLHILPVRSGESKRFKSPEFARHWPTPRLIAEHAAWAVANLEVAIGPIKKTQNRIVDDFNQLVMDACNVASGNLLTRGNILTWNVWGEEPTPVDQEEWRDHAERWRNSIDEGHGSPTGPETPPRYFNGEPFLAAEAVLQEAIDDLICFLKKHLGDL
jgi:hypothetical protein